MKKVAIIGAGPMGLTCALRLLKKKVFSVEIFERDENIGGMSAYFDFGGLLLEKYYHFICRQDVYTLRLLEELGIKDRLRWNETKMGFYYNGRLYEWGDPISLIMFPKLDLLSKLRYGLHIMYTKNKKDFKKLDKIEASEWIRWWIGEKGYDVLWKFLFKNKFFEYSSPFSAAWIATRIRRVGNSRKSIFTEQMGYLEEGTITLLDRMRDEIQVLGGSIHLKAKVERVTIKEGKVKGVVVSGNEKPYNLVFSTVPLPYIPKIIPDLPSPYMEMVRNVKNIGLVCVVFKIKRPLTDNFWLNINDPGIDIPGVIEYSNLRPLDEKIIYVPYYMPQTHYKWNKPKEFFINEVLGYLPLINHEFRKDWVIDTEVFRYEYAQPIFPPDFYEQMPPYKTGIYGLYVADTIHSYPEDRTINESVRIAEKICELVY